jgi:hypothetical protein
MLTPRDSAMNFDTSRVSAVIHLAAASEDGGIAGNANSFFSGGVGVVHRSASSRSMECPSHRPCTHFPGLRCDESADANFSPTNGAVDVGSSA